MQLPPVSYDLGSCRVPGKDALRVVSPASPRRASLTTCSFRPALGEGLYVLWGTFQRLLPTTPTISHALPCIKHLTGHLGYCVRVSLSKRMRTVRVARVPFPVDKI